MEKPTKIFHVKNDIAVLLIDGIYYPCEVERGENDVVLRYNLMKFMWQFQHQNGAISFVERNACFLKLKEAIGFAESEIESYYNNEFFVDELEGVEIEVVNP